VFTNFLALVNFIYENICFHQITNLNIGINHLAFELVAQQHLGHIFVDWMGGFSYVTRPMFEEIIASVKQQCVKVGNQLIIEMQC
jgi:hypothetical protein